MKTVKSTIYAASVLRDIGGRCAYWMEYATKHGDEATNHAMATPGVAEPFLIAELREMHADVVKALADLNEPFSANDTTTTLPLSVS